MAFPERFIKRGSCDLYAIWFVENLFKGVSLKKWHKLVLELVPFTCELLYIELSTAQLLFATKLEPFFANTDNHANVSFGHSQIGQTSPLTLHAPLKKHCPCGQILTWESIEKLRGLQGVSCLQPIEFAPGLVNRAIPERFLTCGCLWEACRCKQL